MDPAVTEEHTWRFWEEQDPGHKDHEHGYLECDREAPDERRCAVAVEGTGVLEPVCNYNTEDVKRELDGDELTTRSVLGGLRSPNGDDRIEDARAPAVHQPCADHPLVVHGRGLQTRANSRDCGANKDGLDTSKTIADGSSDQTANQGSEVVDRHNASLQQGIIDDSLAVRSLVTKTHEGVVVICGVDTAHHTLVVTEEQDR